MKIKVKLIILVSIFIASLVVTGLLSAFQLKSTEESFLEMQEDEKVQVLLKSLQHRFTGISNDERAFLLTGDEELLTGIEDKKEDINTYFDELMKMPNLDQKEVKRIQESFLLYYEENKNMVQTYKVGAVEKALSIHMEDERNIRKQLVDPGVEALISNISREVEQDKILLDKSQNMKATIQYGITLISIVIGLLIAIITIRSISKPINKMNARLREIAEGEGDLTQTIELSSKDELGEMAYSFNKMISKLRELIKQVGYNAEQVAASSEQLSASSEETTRATEQIASTVQDVAIGTTKQVENMNETSITVNNISLSVNKIACSSEVVTTTADQALKKAAEGDKAVATAVRQMNNINDTVNQLSEMVKRLGERSSQIGKIVEAITGIAGQTNLLALNAAIEAARAGEHGRGFAVVADEVRKLAEQSAQSAREITQLITAIQNDTNNTVASMEDTTSQVVEGISFVHDAGKSFEQIQQAVQEVTSHIQEVTSAVQEMSDGTKHLVQSVKHTSETLDLTVTGTHSMSAATEEQLAAMEEISASSTSLSNMAEELKELVGRFKV